MSDDIIDLDEARERRRAGELPPALRQGTIVRRGIGLADEFCLHRETIVDTMARIVRCRSCGADLDPMDVLGQVAHEWEQLAFAIKERQALDDRIIELRADEKRTKARLRRARARAGSEVPPVAGEVQAMRRAVEYLRHLGPYGQAARLVAAVDAAVDAAETEEG